MAAAGELTYARGVGVGVDAILRKAGVARRSLYEHFGGKDGLIAEVIRVSALEDEERYEAVLDRGGDDPRRRVLALFDGLDRITSAEGFRGCRYAAAELALPDPAHPAHAEIRAHKERVRGMLEREVRALGHRDAPVTADELMLLIEGALVSGAVRPGSRPGLRAKALAERVLRL